MMNRTVPKSDRRGFTLVEVLVAVVVLAIGILGLASTVAVVGWNMRLSYLETQLRARAQLQMEGLLARGHEAMVSGERRQSGLSISWQVSGDGLKQLLLVTRQQLGPHEVADTLVTLVLAQ